MISRIRSLFFVIKSTKNWISILLVRYGNKKTSLAKFRNGYVLEVSKENWQKYILHVHLFCLLPSAQLTKNSITFIYRGRQASFSFGDYGFDTIFEIFAFDPYKDFIKTINPKEKTVLDIGAAFGDTAMYFLINGAKNVIAVEAFPGYFNLAKINIKQNGFSDKCEVVLSAVGAKPGSIVIDPDLKDMFGANISVPNQGSVVPMITLANLVDHYSINDGFLKLDTEGYEYDILLNTEKETMRRFSDMLIEYHYGFERLEKYLVECGFSVSHTGPTHVYMPQLVGDVEKNMYTGHILAKRID